MDFPGIEVEIEPIRVYAEGSTAAHILGRTGKIYAEEYQELKEKGYDNTLIIERQIKGEKQRIDILAGKEFLEKYI